MQTERVTVKPNVYTTPTIERSSEVSHSSRAVVLYSASWCGYCTRAKQYFRAKNIQYTEYDVETSTKGQADYARMGMRGVPVILVGSTRINGFSAESFEAVYANNER